ncbi:phage terminase large subunit [Aeribacillus pallidus]|nr:phage terminase large subunit [Aeribacillus pallidus]
MAFVDGKWLDRPARERLINEIREENNLIRRLIKTNKAVDYDLDRLEANLTLLEKLERVHRGERDVLYFAMEYFSDNSNPENEGNLIPSGVNYENAADFHKTLCGLLNDVITGKQREHVAWACPRGHAKTAYLSNIFLAHQVVYRHRKYIVEISETTDVAGDFITWTRYQLKFNAKLREDFGELLDPRPSKNEVDNKYEFITSSGTKVEAKGLGTQMRGLRHGNTRPDLFILDDLESKDSTNTSDLIEKSKAWFREEMLPALSRDGICIYLGTILCFDSLLDYVIRERRDFKSKKFSAVKSWAKRQDLWQRWREIYRSDDPEAAEKARKFYEEHEAEMIEGASILWPEYFTYYEFMVKLEENGTKAFNQEYQNEPTDEERQIFKPEYFTYFDDKDLEGKDISFFGAIDLAMGKERGDYSVIVTMARNNETGVCYVYDVFMERCHPDVLLREAVKRTLQFQYEGLAVEAQMAQEFIADKLSEELRKHGYPSHTRLKYIKQRTRKALRIEALLPDIQAGRIRFRRTDRLALEQFELYPMHKHDDFPDAVSMCYDAAKSGNVYVKTYKRNLR